MTPKIEANKEQLRVRTKCGAAKPVSEYHLMRTRPEGLHKQCKECLKALVRKYYANNSDRKAASVNTYRKTTEQGKETAKRYVATHAVRYPEKDKARRLLRYAVSRGKIVKPDSCEVCGDNVRLQGHHPDYSKPLEAVWLCHPCHRDIHKFSLRSRGLSGGVSWQTKS